MGGVSGKRTVSQMTLWESAGTPVQPAYCSSPAERTMTGFSRVPARISAHIFPFPYVI